MRNWLSRLALLALLLSSPLLLQAQNAAAMTGTVTDPSGAVIPNVVIVLTNPATGAKYNATSNSSGSYRFADVPPGEGYRVTFSLPGFAPLTINGVSLGVSSSRTQNAKLTPGTTESIEVTAGAGVTIDTDDATVGNNTDPKLLNELPVQDRTSGITTLFDLQPGEANGATTGARTDQNNVTLDGLDVNDFATGSYGAIVGNAPIDSVQEFKGTVGGFGTNSGPGGGGQFQLVTKSGTNQFHGNVNEYHRDTSTVANNYFSNLVGVARTPLIRNQFGGNVGGPIKRDKAFFFFDFSDSRIIQNSATTRTVPLDSFRNGNVSYINNSAGCSDASRANTQPSCISSLTPTQVAGLDPQHIGDSTTLFNLFGSRYPHANDLTQGDGVNTGGFRFNAPFDDFTTGYVGRLDYNINSRMAIYGRGTVARENGTEAAIQFPGDPETSPFIDRSYAYVVGFNWQISAKKTNQFIYGETVANYLFPKLYNPQGLYPIGFGTGTTTLIDSPYTSPVNAQGREVPIPMVADNYSWQVGHHGLSFGGSFKWIKTSDFTKLDYSSLGIGLGGEIQGLSTDLRPPNLYDSQTGNADVTYDSAYAAALGRIASITGNFNYDPSGKPLPQGTGDQRHYRYFQTQLYAGDAWKITPHFTINYGVNYELFSVPYETGGFETVQNTSFDKYFGARVAQSAAGRTGADAVPFISYLLGGKVNNGPPLYQPQYNNFAPRLAFVYNPGFDQKTVFNAGAGIIYDRTVINAVQYQQDQYSYLFQQPLEENFGYSGNPRKSLLLDPRLGANIPSLVVAPSTPKPPFTPYVADGQPYGLQNGGAFNESIDPNLRTPYSVMVNFGMQHEFKGNLLLKMSYVGRFGRRLLAQADANQIIDFPDPTSGQLLSTAFGNVTKELRKGADPTNLPAEPWFENVVIPGIGAANGYPNNTSFLADALGSLPVKGDFADTVQAISGITPLNVGMGAQFSENTFYTNKGFSDYDGLLVTLQKNLSHGLQFDANYTWSHSIDNVSLIANSAAYGGYGFVCDALRPRLCRGNSDFDVTHIVTGDFTYALPFGQGQMFASKINRVTDELIGGWALSGITTYQSGAAYTALSSAFVAGYANDAPALFNGNTAALQHSIHKTSTGSLFLYADPAAAAASFQGPIGFQIGGRNTLRGPRYFNQDLGLAKSFGIIPDRGINLKFRADAFNAFNHPSFSSPGTETAYDDITQTSSFGQLTGQANTYRVIQLALRLEF